MEDKPKNITDLMEQCNADCARIQKEIKTATKIIRRMKKDAKRVDIYSEDVIKEIEKDIKQYERKIENWKRNLDIAEYQTLACQYALWDEIEQCNANRTILPDSKRISRWSRLRRFYNRDIIPTEAKTEILDRMVEIQLKAKINGIAEKLPRADKETEKQIEKEAADQVLGKTTINAEKDEALQYIRDEVVGHKKDEPHNIRDKLEKLAAERGRPEVPYTQKLKGVENGKRKSELEKPGNNDQAEK